MASAAEPYVFEHAALFAAEVLRFACAGLGLEAYDRLVFGLPEPSQCVGTANGWGKALFR